jgi:hypothetical protein
MSYDSTFGDGYGADDGNLPLHFNDDGTITTKGYTPSPIQGHTDSSGIGIPLPSPEDEDTPWNPIIPEVAPPTSMFDLVLFNGNEVQFINESLGNVEALLWDFGDGQTSTEENPSHKYSVPATYEVRLWVANEGGDDYHTIFVTTVDPIPSIGFNFAIGGYTVYFTNLSNTPGYLWDFGDGQTSTDRDPRHTYSTTGDYIVTLKTGDLTLQKTVKVDVEILLEWVDNANNEDGFRIEHSLDGSTGWVEIADIELADITSYGVTLAKDGVDSAKVNFFRVIAYNGSGDSDPSNTTNVRCA